MYAPFTVTSPENEVDLHPFLRHSRRPTGESSEVGCNVESRSHGSSVQELEIRKLVSFRTVLLSELPIHFHRRHFSRDDPISPRIVSGWRAVEVSREENGTFGCGGFVSTPD